MIMSLLNRRGFTIAGGALAAACCALLPVAGSARAQTAPSAAEVAAYRGLHRAAAIGDTAQIRKLLADGADPKGRDAAGRTPPHLAACGSHHEARRRLGA